MSPTALTPLPPPVIPKMDPEKKGWWVEALRSDRFRRGRSALRKRDSSDRFTAHCCLGVLCEVAIEHGLDLTVTYGGDGETYFDGEALLLPDRVVEWAGLEKNGPEVWQDDAEGQHKVELTLINDDTEDTFAEIADRIERDL